MSTSHEARHQHPADGGKGGSCCGGDKAAHTEHAHPSGEPAEAATTPSPTPPNPKEPVPRPADGGGHVHGQ